MRTTQILMNDFRRIPEDMRAQLEEAAKKVICSGWYVLGEELSAFEKAWATYCGVKRAIGVANGLDAIEIGLRVLGIGPGDEVVTTPMTAFASILGIVRAGAKPVLADIDPMTGLLDPTSVERCIGARTRAVLLVHLYGQIRAMNEWEKLCARHNLLLLEDAAQAHGAEWHGRRAGAFGQWAAYSFYPTKNLGCLGDGGALCTNDGALGSLTAQFRNYGQSERYHHPILGLNSRLDEIQAAFLQTMLKHLPATTARRRQTAARYHANLRSSRVTLLAPPETTLSHAYHLFVVCAEERTALQSHLASRKIQSLIHYPICAHHQPPTTELRRDPRGLVSAERFASQCLSIPCHPYLTDSEVEVVIEAINAF